MKKVKMLLVKPMEVPCVVKIDSMGEGIEALLGGPREAFFPDGNKSVFYYHEWGKAQGLPLNRAICDSRGEVYDIVAGNFIICRPNSKGKDLFRDLPEALIEKYSLMFAQPEDPGSLLVTATILHNWQRR